MPVDDAVRAVARARRSPSSPAIDRRLAELIVSGQTEALSPTRGLGSRSSNAHRRRSAGTARSPGRTQRYAPSPSSTSSPGAGAGPSRSECRDAHPLAERGCASPRRVPLAATPQPSDPGEPAGRGELIGLARPSSIARPAASSRRSDRSAAELDRAQLARPCRDLVLRDGELRLSRRSSSAARRSALLDGSRAP